MNEWIACNFACQATPASGNSCRLASPARKQGSNVSTRASKPKSNTWQTRQANTYYISLDNQGSSASTGASRPGGSARQTRRAITQSLSKQNEGKHRSIQKCKEHTERLTSHSGEQWGEASGQHPAKQHPTLK